MLLLLFQNGGGAAVDGNASGALAAIQLTPATGSASGGIVIDGNASSTPSAVQLTPTTGSATGTAEALGPPAAVSLTAATGSANGSASADGNAAGFPAAPTLTAATGSASADGVAQSRNAGFEMGRGIREVSFKPLLQRIREARQAKVKPAQKNAQKRARIIEIEAAHVALEHGGESEFKVLMGKWLAQSPVVTAQARRIDSYELFMAQVALRIAAIEQDEEDAVIALLML